MSQLCYGMLLIMVVLLQIALVLGIVVLLPFSLLSVVPAYFFGGVLIYIGFCMMSEWLFLAR